MGVAALRGDAPLLLGVAIALAVPTAALAEPGYSLTVASDDRFRGQSTSDGLPVATATISYDDISGAYGGVSVTLAPTRNDGLQALRSIQYIGYAHRLPSGLALDAGVTNRLYSRYATVEYARRFTQAYVGVVGRAFRRTSITRPITTVMPDRRPISNWMVCSSIAEHGR